MSRSRTCKWCWRSPKNPLLPERPMKHEHHDHPLAQLLTKRIAIIDGAMGTTIRTYGMTEADMRGSRFKDAPKDLLNNSDLFSLTQPQDDRRHPPPLPRGRRRHHRDQHLRRDQHRAERVLRRRSARARRPQGSDVLPEDHRGPVPQRPGVGDQRAVGAPVPRSGPIASATPTASSASWPARSDRSRSRSRIHPTPRTPGSAW